MQHSRVLRESFQTAYRGSYRFRFRFRSRCCTRCSSFPGLCPHRGIRQPRRMSSCRGCGEHGHTRYSACVNARKWGAGCRRSPYTGPAGEPVGCRVADEGRGSGISSSSSSSSRGSSGISDAPHTVWEFHTSHASAASRTPGFSVSITLPQPSNRSAAALLPTKGPGQRDQEPPVYHLGRLSQAPRVLHHTCLNSPYP